MSDAGINRSIRTLDRGLIWGVLSWTILQGVGFIWWAATITDDVRRLKEDVRTVSQDHGLLTRIDERTDWMKTGIQQLTGQRIEDKDKDKTARRSGD